MRGVDKRQKGRAGRNGSGKPGEGGRAEEGEPARPAGPEPYDADAERRAILDAVHGRGEFAASSGGGRLAAPDAYQHLLSRERRVLDTVDRVVNDARRSEVRRTPFLRLPLHVIGMRTLSALRGLLDDLVEARSLTDVRDALMQEDRKVYLGTCLLLLAFCLMVIQASG
jgi:hypothetical protein